MKTSSAQLWDEEAWKAVSLVWAWGLGMISLWIAFRGTRFSSPSWMAGMGIVLGGCVAASGIFQSLLQDFFAQFHYREKFAYFLAHAVLLIAPLGSAGPQWLWIGVALILMAQGAQLIAPAGYHRYLAAGAALAAAGFLRGSRDGEIAWALAWSLFAAGHLFMERIRFALEKVRDLRTGVSIHEAAQAFLLAGAAPIALAAALAALWRPPSALKPAALGRFSISPFASPEPNRPWTWDQLESLLWQSLGLAAGIAIAIAFLKWYASRKEPKSARPPEPEEVLAAAQAVQAPAASPPRELDPLEGPDTRSRILRLFRRMEERLAGRKAPRAPAWTSREYVRRIAEGLAQNQPESRLSMLSSIFEKARYSPTPPSAGEAKAFEEAAERLLQPPPPPGARR